MLKWGVVIRHNPRPHRPNPPPPTITMAITITITIWKHCDGPERGVSWVFIGADYILTRHAQRAQLSRELRNWTILFNIILSIILVDICRKPHQSNLILIKCCSIWLKLLHSQNSLVIPIVRPKYQCSNRFHTTGSKMMSWYESTKHTFLKVVKWC